MTSRRPVLIVDDEEHNVEPFKNYLASCDIPFSYASTVNEAAVEIFDRHQATNEVGAKHLENAEREFGVVILDNHFRDTELSSYCPNFNGIDLAIILTGKTESFRPFHRRFADDYFGDSYPEIVGRYKNRVIIFSGSARTESISRPDLFAGLTIADKFPDSSNSIAEESLVEILESRGYDFSRCHSEMRDYKTRHGLSRGRLPNDREDYYDMRCRKQKRMKGFDPQDY